MTHYDVLGVAPGSSSQDIRRAYVDLARRHHPDFHTNAPAATRTASEQEMQRINEAWAVLGDESARRTYDLGLVGGRTTDGGADAPPAPGHGWVPGSGTASPDFVPFDDDDEMDDEAREAWLESLDDGPIGNARPLPRWQQLLPVALLGAALFFMAFGLVVNLPELLGLGVVLLVASGVSFVITPMLAVLRTYERDPD